MFQDLIDDALADAPQARGVLLHVEAPREGISWSGVAAGSGATTGQSVHADSTAMIASITKTYTAAATLRLVEQGHFKLNDAIDALIPGETASRLKDAGYRPDRISAAHLLSNTSGLFDYVDSNRFQDRTTAGPSHVWTREEQLDVALSDGEPAFPPGEQFRYSETNALLLTLILERFTDLPFAAAMRHLLRYRDLELRSTWFPILEEAPAGLRPRVRQFATSLGVDSHGLHPTFDLFGGGGIVSTTDDVARFIRFLFAGRVFDRRDTLDLMLTKAEPRRGGPCGYRMGLAEVDVEGRPALGHGGFWGSMVKHLPHLDATVAVFLLERDSWPLNLDIIAAVGRRLATARDDDA